MKSSTIMEKENTRSFKYENYFRYLEDLNATFINWEI